MFPSYQRPAFLILGPEVLGEIFVKLLNVGFNVCLDDEEQKNQQ